MAKKDERRGRPDGHKRSDAICPNCGVVRSVESRYLLNNEKMLCVKCSIQKLSEERTTHGASRKSARKKDQTLYSTWSGMISRCSNKGDKHFKNYGLRGIEVCERWRDFEKFRDDMGERPEGTSLDRIDNNGHYCPENCRWATHLEQMNNQRKTRFIDVGGVSMSVGEIRRKFNLPHHVVYNRIIAYGWDIERATTTPVKQRNK